MKIGNLLLALFTLCSYNSYAQMSGRSNAGTEFIFSMPPCYIDAGADNSIRIYVSSAEKTEVTLTANSFQRKAMTVPNGVIEFELSPGQGQVYTKGLNDMAQPERVFQQAAIHITAGAPVICYAVTRFHYTSDSFLAIPISALGKDYIVSSYPDMTAMYPTYVLPSLTTITAAYNNTRVMFTLGGNNVTTTAGGMKPGQMKQWTLNKGDVIVIGSKGMEADLSGSRITATKPVAVTSGNQCANIPTNNTACDFIAEMELPIHTWGKEYHYTPLISRKFNGIIRVYAKENNTNVFLDGQSWKLIQKGGGGRIGENYFEARIPGEPAPHVISADKPIYVVQYNPGQSEDNVSSDPFQMTLTPLERYQQELTFSTPGIRGGAGFAQNYLNLVYELTPDNTIPDDLEFAQADNFSGGFIWRKLSALFSGSIGRKFPVLIAGKPYAAKIITLPGDGVYKIRSKSGSKFAAYSYGFDSFDSYGMPASASFASSSDGLAPVFQWTMDCDGVVSGVVRDTTDDSHTIENIGQIRIVQDSSENYLLTTDSFVPGEQVMVQWKLTPIDKSKPAKALVIFTDLAGNENSETISYSPSAITAQGLSFGSFRKGSSDPAATEKIFFIGNTGSTVRTISGISIEPAGAFTILNEPTYPLILQPGAAYELRIRFNTNMPQGAHTATLSMTTQECGEIRGRLTAESVAPVIQATDAEFGTTAAGTMLVQLITVRNTGTADLSINGATDLSVSAFEKLAPVSGTGISAWDFNVPVVVPQGDSVQFRIGFNPGDYGNYQDTIYFMHDGEPLKEFAVLNGKVEIGTGIGDIAGSAVRISPNPAQNYVFFSFTAPGRTEQISVFNALGERIFAQYIETAEGVRIDTENLPNGSYYIRIGSLGTVLPFVIKR